MLSFDCTPSFIFPDQFAGFDVFAQQKRARARLQRGFQEYSPRRQVQLQRHQDPFEQLFKLCDTRAHRMPPIEHHSRVVQLNGSYQIQVLKKNDPSNSFKDYEVNYKVTDVGNTLISIQSQGDDFQKTFAFQAAGIDIKKIGWRTVENVLVVDVPKRVETKKELNRNVHKDNKKVVMPTPVEELHTSEPESKSESKKEHKKKEHKKKEHKKKEHKKRVISIPITFGHFEDDVRVRSNQSSPSSEPVPDSELTQLSDSELSTCSSTHELSDAEESMPSPKLPKLTRRVSLEEVEDESLHQMDLD